ncbi:acetylesterase, partial [Cellulomonas aerilata]
PGARRAAEPTDRPSALGGYEDWPAWQRDRPTLDGDDVSRAVGGALGVPVPDAGALPGAGAGAATVPAVRTLDRWETDGVAVEHVEWWVGFGPATRAWVLRPAAPAAHRLPGVLLLHCHAGVKSIGAERMVPTPAPTAVARRLRRDLYEGRALAHEIARAGFVVLAHDTFGWGSRRFHLDPLPLSLREPVRHAQAAWAADGLDPDADERYDAAAGLHEHVVAKTAGTLGTSFAGMVAHDDLVATAVLRSLPDVDPTGTAAVGFSGGGGRAATLASLVPDLRAAGVVGMMTTTDALLPAYADAHSWLLTTPGLLGRRGLPEIAAARRTHHLLALSFRDDALFPPHGVDAAHQELGARFGQPATTGSLEGVVHPGGHVFSASAQALVVDWLQRRLGSGGALPAVAG